MSKISGILLKYAFLGFIASTITKGIPCKPKLSIVQNVSALDASVPFAIDIKNGTNFSLTCKISETQMNDTLLWAKAIETSSSATKMQVQVNKHRPNVTLSFVPVTFTNQGIYFCASPKHRLVEVVYILVAKDVRSSSKWKRSITDYKPISNGSTDRDLSEFPRIPNMDQYHFADDINSLKNDNDKHQKEFDEPRKIDTSAFWKALVGIFVIAAICGLIYLARKWCEEDDNDQFSPVENNTSNAQAPLVTFSSRHTDTEVADSTRPLNIRSFRNLDHLDLPPTYADSVENSRASSMNSLVGTNSREGSQNLSSKKDESILPPTYDEALTNPKPSAPSYHEITDW